MKMRMITKYVYLGICKFFIYNQHASALEPLSGIALVSWEEPQDIIVYLNCHPMTYQSNHTGVKEVQSLPIRNPELEGRGRTSPRSGMRPDTHVREAGWASKPVWKARKISPSPAFDPRTVHSVASRYTVYSNPEDKVFQSLL